MKPIAYDRSKQVHKIETNQKIVFKITNLYITIFSILTIISLAFLYYEGKDLYSIWTFRVADPPWLPPSFQPTKIIGEHTFGDFQLPYTLALDSSPYGWSFYNPTMPLGFILYSFLTILSVKSATIIFLLLGISVFRSVLRKYFGNLENAELYTNIYAFSSIPVVVCLDRGGIQLLAFALLFAGLKNQILDSSKNTETKNQFLDYTFLAVAVSLKIYLIVPILLIIFVNKKAIEFFKIFGSIFILGNLMLSFFYGGPIKVVQGLLNAYIFQTGAQEPGWIFGGVSFSKFFAALYYYSHTYEESIKFATEYQKFVFIPGIFYLILIYFLIIKKELPKTYKITIILTTVFMITPVSGVYTLCVCSFIIALIYFGLTELNKKEKLLKYRYLIIMFSTVISMVPVPSEYYQTVVSGIWATHLVALFVFAILDKVISKPRERV